MYISARLQRFTAIQASSYLFDFLYNSPYFKTIDSMLHSFILWGLFTLQFHIYWYTTLLTVITIISGKLSSNVRYKKMLTASDKMNPTKWKSARSRRIKPC